MCKGSDSARKTPRHGRTTKIGSTSEDVEDELASMRGTKDTEQIKYLERKQIRSVCDVEEEPWIGVQSTGGDGVGETSSPRSSRDSSPAKALHLSKKHAANSASDRGICM